MEIGYLPPPPDPEAEAIARIAQALDTIKVDQGALDRVLRWANDRYGSHDD